MPGTAHQHLAQPPASTKRQQTSQRGDRDGLEIEPKAEDPVVVIEALKTKLKSYRRMLFESKAEGEALKTQLLERATEK